MNKLFFFLAIIFLFSCSKSPNNSTPPTKSNGLLPLSVGNFWQYIKTSYDSSGATIGTSMDEIDITGQITVSGVTYYQQTQASITNINSASFFINLDSNTLEKIDSSVQYTFFKRVTVDSTSVDIWSDTVTSRCKGHNYLYGFTDSTNINGYVSLRNIVYVLDCTGDIFEKWVYYLEPGLGFTRILHYVLQSNGTFYLQFEEDLSTHHTN